MHSTLIDTHTVSPSRKQEGEGKTGRMISQIPPDLLFKVHVFRSYYMYWNDVKDGLIHNSVTPAATEYRVKSHETLQEVTLPPIAAGATDHDRRY